MTERGNRKIKTGKVVSDKMDKSRVILVETYGRHKLYGKFVRKSKKFMVHDESNASHIGDTITIMETRPLSRNKRWRLVEIVEKAK